MIQKKSILICALMMGTGVLILPAVSLAKDPMEVKAQFALQMEGKADGQPMTIKLDKTLEMTGNAKKSAFKLPTNPQIFKISSNKKSEERPGGTNQKTRINTQNLANRAGMAQEEQ